MRKNELLNQNMSLFEQLQKADLELRNIKIQLSEKENEIAALKQIINKKSAVSNENEPLKKLEKKMEARSTFAADKEYAASVIGKIVVESARYSGKLKDLSSTVDIKELISLILGRTEISKAEILNIISTDQDFETKKQQINFEYTDTLDYFRSVIAQKEENF